MRKKFETIFSKRKSVMKISRLKKEIAFVLALTMLVTFVPVSAMNEQESGTGKKTVEAGNVLGQTETSWEQKISEDVWSKIESADDEEKIPVWIWFKDIDHQEVEEYVTRKTGLSEETLAVEFEPVSKELKTVLIEESMKESSARYNKSIEEVLADYIESTEEQRIEEQNRTKTYIQAQRTALKEAYIEQNCTMIEALKLPKEEIIFQSQLTPSIIIYLTKTQIIELAQIIDVEVIDYYSEEEGSDHILEEENNPEEDVVGYDYESSGVDRIHECSGLTGMGINVLVVDRYVEPKRFFYSQLKKENIWLINNETVIPLLNITDFGDYLNKSDFSHGNMVTARLQKAAPDVKVYSVASSNMNDIEKAITDENWNLNINIVNMSIDYVDLEPYANNSRSRWIDYIVKNSNITVLAAGGNFQKVGDTKVASPGNAYNTIAVGAYGVSLDDNGNKVERMWDYKYNPETSEEYVNYKPDIVAAASNTSAATPLVSGIVAMMIQLKPSLATKPELIKAILMASCHRKVLMPLVDGVTESSENMIDGLTRRQGAGAVDAYRAVSIVALEQYGMAEISLENQEINIGEIVDGNVNVSLVWMQNPDSFINTNGTSQDADDTLIIENVRNLNLQIFAGTQLKGISNKTNAGKQLVYFNSSGEIYKIEVTKTGGNTEDFEYAYAWSTEDMEFDLDVRASVTDLETINGNFTYTGMNFSQDQGLYSNREFYVVLKKYNDSGLVYTSPVYTTSMNENSFGTLTNIEGTVKTFSKNEYIEILTYFGSECTEEKMISRQYFRPTMFEFVGW